MDLGADNQRRRGSAQLLGTRPSIAVDAGAPASEAAYARTQLTPPIREHRGSPSENRGVRGAQVDDKSGSWNHHYHHRPHHHYSDQGRVSPYNFDARPHTSDSREDPRHQTQQTTAWPYERLRLGRLNIRNPDHRTGHLALYPDQMPVSQEIGRRYPVTGRVSPVVDISEPGLARNTRGAVQGRGTGQDQSMPASCAQIRQRPDACPPSISAHHVNPFPESHRTSHVRNIYSSRNGHELVQDEHPFERQPPPQRAGYPPHSPPLFIHTTQRGQEQEYIDSDRRSPQISPMEYDYRRTQSSLSPQALISPLQLLLRAPSNPAGMDGGNRMKFTGRQYSPTPSGHYARDQQYKLDSKGNSQLRHHPYRYSPPQPTRRHSESLSPQGHWTHTPREHQYPQQHQQQQEQQQEQHRQQQLQPPDQTSSREHLVSQNRRNEYLDVGRQHGKGYEGKETRPKNYELSIMDETMSGTTNDRGQPCLQPFTIHPLRTTGSPVSSGQAHEETPAQARPPVRMTLALSFSNVPSNAATSRVDQRTLIPQHQYHALRLSPRQQQDRPSCASAAIVSRPPLSPHEGALTFMSPAEYDRHVPAPESRVSATPQHGEQRVSFIEYSLDETARPHMITRGSSLEARWEPRPRTLGSSASNQEVQDGDESPDPALPRRHSVADTLELRPQDRRGDVGFGQERLQDMRSKSKSLVAAPGEVCSAHYVATPSRPEQQEWLSRNLREHFGRPLHDQQQQPMFVEIRGRDSTLGSSSEAGGPLSSTLASPTERSMRKDMFSATTRLAENGYGIQKQEPMENELPPGSIAVAAAAAETITGIGTAEYRSNNMEVGSLPSPAPRNDLGLPGYYTEHDIRKLYWQWRTCEEEDRRPNQQSQQSDREDVSMVGADEGDAHDDGGTNDVWTESQHVDRHLRNGPELRHSGQEREDGARSPNKGKSRKVDDAEDAGRHDDAGERRREGSQDPETEEWDIEDEENEDDDDDEDDGEGEDNEEQCDDGYCDSEICDEPRADDWGGKNAVAKRTRTQTRRKRQLRRHYENSAGAPSRAGTSGPGECLRRARAKDDKKHGCEECQKRFSRPSQLRTHQLTHSGEKPHQCPLCDKSFNVASNLKRHIRTHDKIPRKNSRDGSGVFRGFTQGFQAKHNPILKASSPDGIRKARAAKTNLSSSAIISRRSTGTTQPPEKLRWMSTETPESSMMAATRQAKIAANKQRTGDEGASSSANPGSTTSPSEIITRANAQPAAAVGIEAAASVARPLPLTGSSTPGYHPSQPLPPPTPQPSRESDSESTLVEGTQASDGDDDMGNSEPGLDNSDINSHGG